MYVITVDNTAPVVYLSLVDSTTGLAKTGLAYNTNTPVCYYTRPKAAATIINLATQTVTGAYSSGGFVEVSSSNAPGLYRLDLPTATIASGADYVIVSIGFTGVKTEHLLVIIDALPSILSGTVTADAGNTKSSFKTSLSGSLTNAFILFTGGILLNEVKPVNTGTGAAGLLTIGGGGFSTTPAGSDPFLVINR